MNGSCRFGANRTGFVDGRAENIHDAAEALLPHRHHDRRTGVGDFHAAFHAVGRTERDGADQSITKLLLHFERQTDLVLLQSIVNLGHVLARELDVHHGANDLNDFALGHCVHRYCLSLDHLNS
jgi:hypothetical protein